MKKDWVDFSDLIKKLEVLEIEIFPYLIKGLKPYSKYKRPIQCPKRHHKGRIIETQIIEIEKIILEKESDLYGPNAYSDKDFSKIEENIKKMKRLSADLRKEHEAIIGIDPNCTSWRFYSAPSVEEYNYEAEIENILNLLKNSIYEKKNVNNSKILFFLPTDKEITDLKSQYSNCVKSIDIMIKDKVSYEGITLLLAKADKPSKIKEAVEKSKKYHIPKSKILPYLSILYAEKKWFTDPTLSIKDMIEILQKQREIKRSAKTIRKWIKEVAPPERCKPGAPKKLLNIKES